jgi:hypothetical protein
MDPAIVSDGAGAIIAWMDERDPATGSNVCFQRVNAAGQVQWARRGSATSLMATREWTSPNLVTDGAGGRSSLFQDDYRE